MTHTVIIINDYDSELSSANTFDRLRETDMLKQAPEISVAIRPMKKSDGFESDSLAPIYNI